MKKLFLFTLIVFAMNNSLSAQSETVAQQADHYTFQISDKVTCQKVTFRNRYGITFVGRLVFISILGISPVHYRTK